MILPNVNLLPWQIENEPLLDFGICQRLDTQFLKAEADLVRSQDQRTIILTDSGELNDWIEPMRLADKMGTTMYRKVWNAKFGYLYYPLPPLFYSLKEEVVKRLFQTKAKEVFIAELQAEPWPPGKPLRYLSIADQLKIFSLKDLHNSVTFAQKTGFKEQYLWGVEWWYFMKIQGHSEYWDYAKSLFK